MDLPNRADLMTVGRRYLRLAPNTRVNPALVDVRGSDLNLIVGQTSVMGEALSAAWARCARGLLVDTAQGDELDRIAYDRFGLTRKPAAAASVDVALTRGGGPGAPGVIEAGARLTSPQGSIFALDNEVAFGPTDTLKVARATALVVGPEQNVHSGALSAWIDPPFDTSIYPFNPGAAAGGTDRESDPWFKGRIRGFFLTVRRGTLAAIQYGATQVPGVEIATAFEVVNPGTALPAGAGQVVVGDANGNASSGMLQAVRDEELSWRPCGVPVFVSGGVPRFIPVSYRLSFEVGTDTVAAAEEVRAVVVALTQFNRPGQPLTRYQLMQAPGAVPGVIVRDSTVVVPVGDIETDNVWEILRVRAEDVSFV